MAVDVIQYLGEKSGVEEAQGWNGAGWYFWDETWGYCHGPEPTFLEAHKQLQEYIKWLNSAEHPGKVK
jgi:hypothetical protein